MAWPVPKGIALEDAFYNALEKYIGDSSWNRFARLGLRLHENDISDIESSYRGVRKEQKYQMCQKWKESAGADATVNFFYALVNHFLRPNECPDPRCDRGAVVKIKSADSSKFGGRRVERIQPCSDVDKVDVIPSTQEFIKSKLSSLSDCYRRTAKNGIVIIINNHFKEHGEGRRHGSEIDLKNMVELWKQLGCKVDEYEDLSGDDMRTHLTKFADTCGEYDYCATIVMSHGNVDERMDFIYGNDGKTKIYKKEIYKIFDNETSPHLQGIPKLFFFQSCRGGAPDKGVPVHTTRIQRAFNDTKLYVGGEEYAGDNDVADVFEEEPSRLPTSSDHLIAHASQFGYQAFRNVKEGSWFINAIVNIFSEYAKEKHVADLMVHVNRVVKEKMAASGGKAFPHVELGLTKSLYLFPIKR